MTESLRIGLLHGSRDHDFPLPGSLQKGSQPFLLFLAREMGMLAATMRPIVQSLFPMLEVAGVHVPPRTRLPAQSFGSLAGTHP
jgi:hypothetical protein